MATAQDLATTQSFIDYRPSAVALKRRPKTATPDGGWKFGAEAAAGNVTLRVVELLRAQATTERMSSSGKLVLPTHIAVMMPAVDMRRYDYFDWDGLTWEVLWVSKLPDWRKQAELIGRG